MPHAKLKALFYASALLLLTPLICVALLLPEADDKPIMTITWNDLVSYVQFALWVYCLLKLPTAAFAAIAQKPKVETESRSTNGVASLISASVDQLVARHEAAHAVAAYLHGFTVNEVSTKYNSDLHSSGHVDYSFPRSSGPSAETQLLARIVVCLSGPAASYDTQAANYGAPNDDYAFANRLAISLAIISAMDYSEILDSSTEKARRLVTEHAELIDHLAEKLHPKPTTLTGTEVIEIIEDFISSRK